MLLWRDLSLTHLRAAIAAWALVVAAPALGAGSGPQLSATGPAGATKTATVESKARAPERAAVPEKALAVDRDAPASPEPSAEALEPAPRVPTAVLAYDAAGLEPEAAQRLENAMLAALRGDRRLGLLDVRDGFDPAEPALVALSKVQEQLEQARTFLETKRPAEAGRLLDAATATLVRELGHVSTPEGVADSLREALGLQASVAFNQGDRPRSLSLLQSVFNIDRRMRWVSRLFPESMKDFVEDARQQFLNATRGVLQLGSNPGGAQIFVGGKKVGQGRATVEGLPPGTHYVTWVRRNRRALTSRVVVQPGATTELVPTLLRYGTDDPIARLEAAEGQLGKAAMPLPAVEAATALRADLLVLLQAQADKGVLRVSAYLYDRRLRTLLGKGQGAVSAEAPERDMPKVAAALLTGAQLDGQTKIMEKPKAPPAPRAPTGFEKISRSKWFWPVVGSVAGAILAGAVVDIALRR